MANKQKYLKSTNTMWLGIFVVLNLSVFLSITLGHDLTDASVTHYWQRLSAKDGVYAICVPLAIFVLSAVIGDLGKARLVFWRWNNPLPGTRAFSVIMNDDPRIDTVCLRSRFNPLPSEPKEQNALWYRLYKKHSGDSIVSEAHRMYLLTRDMSSLAAVFWVTLAPCTLISSTRWQLAICYSMILFVLYLIIATAARNYGVRFVAHVLVLESHSS